MMQGNNSQGGSNGSQLLVAHDLRKSYGPRPALRGLSFSLTAGRILGFLGPNGAGKTTAIRILTTILEPDSGHFVIAGISSQYPERIRRKIGVLPENLGFPKNITGIEYLTYFARLYGRDAHAAKTLSLALLEEVGLGKRARSLVGSYSHGMRQRLGIARALVNDPVVIFLDEPTLGLDPRGQQELLALVRRMARERDAGIILCSHDLPEVESVCDDVVILNLGQVVASGTVTEVIGQARSGKSGIREDNGVRVRVPSNSVSEAQRAIEAVSGVRKVTPGGEITGWLRVEFTELTNGKSREYSYRNNRILEALLKAEIPILGLEAEGNRLQDVFLYLTEEPIK